MDNKGSLPLQRPVSIIILAWNGIKYTKKCLRTLKLSIDAYAGPVEVIVVDNGSTDGSVEYFQSLDWIKLIANNKNLGYTKGNNIGIKAAASQNDIILLNNDVEILHNDWLLKLQECVYKDRDIGLAGCRLLLGDGRLLHAGTFMPLETLWGQQIGGGQKDINQYGPDREVEGIVFACVYIRRSVIEKIGVLDEDFFAYFEDTDYCLRAKEAGLKVFYCGSVNLIHHENVSTSVNKVRHNDLFLKSMEIFRRKWLDKLRSHKYFTEINWHSIFNFETGYAITSREIALVLDRSGVKVNYKYVYGEGSPFSVPEPEHSDIYMLNVFRSRPFKSGRVEIVYAQGDVFDRNTGSHKIGYTMLETDRIPKEWARQANLMDEVWTPSHFNKETFQESGVTKPVHVIPLGIDINYFNPSIKGFRTEGPFIFMSIFEWGERKAPEILLKAFNDEFNCKEDAMLFVKTFNNDQFVSVSSQVKNMGLKSHGGKICISLNEIVPAYQLGYLYKSADCFVLPTRGEGWGMPILEAMACGLPVIATNWSAQTDFMKEDNSFPLNVEKLIPAVAKCPYYHGFNWAEPSYEHLRYLMRYLYEHREIARKVGEKAAEEVAHKWTWEKAAEKIIERISNI